MTEEPRLKRSLTVFPLVVIGLAYMDPLVVFDSYGIVAQLTKGHVVAAYIFTLLALLLTALSYGNMVKAFPKAGSAYTYAQKVFILMSASLWAGHFYWIIYFCLW